MEWVVTYGEPGDVCPQWDECDTEEAARRTASNAIARGCRAVRIYRLDCVAVAAAKFIREERG